MSNLYLIGMMGSGKTVTGRALAEQLSRSFIDLDHELEVGLGRKIAQIFQTKGENFFRAQEKKILSDVSAGNNQVVSTGGGIILDPENVQRMKQTGKVIYLETSLESLWKRVKDKTHRPLLKSQDPKATLENLLNQRKPAYEAASDIRVVTDHQSAAQVAKEIIQQL